MINGYPTEEELRERISKQLAWRQSSDTVALIWRGYLAALLEWGLLEVDVYDRILNTLLPRVGSEELYELSSGEPISAEQKKEIIDFLRNAPKP